MANSTYEEKKKFFCGAMEGRSETRIGGTHEIVPYIKSKNV